MQSNLRIAPIVPKKPKPALRKSTPKSPSDASVEAEVVSGYPKVSIPIAATDLPFDLIRPEPAPQPPVVLHMVSPAGVCLQATISGKAFRRCVKAVVADGPIHERQFVIIQGRLAPAGNIEEAGLSYVPKPTSPET